MNKVQFKDQQLNKVYEDKLEELRKLTDTPVQNTAYLWDKTVERYASNVERVKRIFQTDEMKSYVTTKLLRDMDMFLRRCSNAEFHIALVGAIKAGKSTLINALLGYEYASMNVTPETAALTKFRSGETNYVKVVFYTAEEWERLWKSAKESKAEVFLEEYEQLSAESEKQKWLGHKEEIFQCEDKAELALEIAKWTSSKAAGHYFVKEVEVGIKEFDMPSGVVLVDTPGLDDVVEYRSNITREYIDRANAVLVCVKSDALTGQELATIYSVFANTRHNPEKVYIVATQLDTLNDPIDGWKKQKEEWLKSLKTRSAYGSLELAKKNVIGVSAYLYLLLKQYGNMADDDDNMANLMSIFYKLKNPLGLEGFAIDKNYGDLNDFSQIEILEKKMWVEIVDKYRQFLIEDIKNNYLYCKEEIKEAVSSIRASQEEIIRTSQGGIEEIRKKQQEYAEKYKAAESEKKEFEMLLKLLQNMTHKRTDELEQAIRALGGK